MLPDAMSHEHEAWMHLAIEEAERARGNTGDNPWVGCVIVSVRGDLLGRGHTLGPGEDPLDRQLDQLAAVKVLGVGRERRAGRVLDALVDR